MSCVRRVYQWQLLRSWRACEYKFISAGIFHPGLPVERALPVCAVVFRKVTIAVGELFPQLLSEEMATNASKKQISHEKG